MLTWKKIFPLNVCYRRDPDWGNQVRNLSPPTRILPQNRWRENPVMGWSPQE